jgi:hypothetical protein
MLWLETVEDIAALRLMQNPVWVGAVFSES